jgi:hypothetical protein
MNKKNKKQAPQIIVLGILAVGMFGLFGYRMLKPSPAAARTQAAKQTTSHDVMVASVSTEPTGPLDAKDIRDPFIPGMADPMAMDAYRKSMETAKPVAAVHPVKSAAWNKIAVPAVPPMPSFAG